MRLIAMMLARNEEWVIEFSIRVALKWCDAVVVLNDSSTDKTGEILERLSKEFPDRVIVHYWYHGEHWEEMAARQHLLELGRKAEGTHFAIVDADEALTANLVPHIREVFQTLASGEAVEVPMLAMRDLWHYQDDDTVWSRAWLTLGFKDAPFLAWASAADGYCHHSRAPRGVGRTKRHGRDKSEGGGMHLQWCNHKRIEAKHVHYRMAEQLRWPGRKTPQQLNEMYDAALEAPRNSRKVPDAFMEDFPTAYIDTVSPSHYPAEIRAMIETHGKAVFSGLDLKGYA